MEEQIKIRHELQFGVPIYEADLPGFDERKQELIDHFLTLRETSAGAAISNQGGWHSAGDLHRSEEPCVKSLLQLLARTGIQCIKHTRQIPEAVRIAMVSSWVMINEAGDWNVPHAHFPCDWSGVCYININDKEAKVVKGNRDGDILFFDPLPLGPKYQRPPTISKTPADGKVFVFPSYLVHMVAPHFDEGMRIAVSFNFNLVAR